MPGDRLSRRIVSTLLRAGRTAAVVLALAAFVHVTLPHHHAGNADERSCAACQIARHDAAGVPPQAGVCPAPPAGTEAPRTAVRLARPARVVHAAPLPSRGPPPASPSEPL